MEYNKLPIDFPEQLSKLKERGMIITNEDDALELHAILRAMGFPENWQSEPLWD